MAVAFPPTSKLNEEALKKRKARKNFNNSLPKLVFWAGILVWLIYIIYMVVKYAEFK